MSHLRIVGNERPKPKKRKGQRFSDNLLTPEEQSRAAQALKNLRCAFGTWGCLADASGVSRGMLISVANGYYPLTVALLFAVGRASGLTIDDLLSAPVPTDRCRACGQVKRYAKALEARAV